MLVVAAGAALILEPLDPVDPVAGARALPLDLVPGSRAPLAQQTQAAVAAEALAITETAAQVVLES